MYIQSGFTSGLQHNSTDFFHVNLLDGSYRTLLSQRRDGEMVHALNERSSDGKKSVQLFLSPFVFHRPRELGCYGNSGLYLASATEVLF